MVVIFVALTILALLAIDYFIIRPRQQQKREEEISIGELIPLTKTMQNIPAGVFLQPSFTWTKVQDDGLIKVGLHPLILGLIGPPYEVELMQNKELVDKDDPLLRVRKNGRYMTLKSPVAGEIIDYNQALLGETDWEHLNMSWLYKIRPRNVTAEMQNWQYSEDADEWMNEQYRQIKSFIFEKAAPTDVGMTLADGGDVPMGILADLDEQAWNEFAEKFVR